MREPTFTPHDDDTPTRPDNPQVEELDEAGRSKNGIIER